MRAVRQPYLLAVVSFLLIPVVGVGGLFVFTTINPEWAAGNAHYVRNYQLIDLGRKVVWFGSLGACVVLWFATCWFVIRAKQRSTQWILAGFLGPLGLAALCALRNKVTNTPSLYDRFLARMTLVPRIAYEAVCFVALLTLANYAMEAKREASIRVEAVRTGLTREQVIAQRDEDGGMYAFSEGNEVIYVFALLYLLRPVVVNAAGAATRRA